VRKFLKRLRLLPVVMLACAGLLAVKGAGLALEAQAQDASTQGAPTQDSMSGQAPTAPGSNAAPAPQSSDPAADDMQLASAAEVDVLTSLSKRRAELDAREQDQTLHENLIDAAEKRVDGRIADLKQLESEIRALLGQRDDAAQKQLDSLVKTYSSMKPKDAARIFNALNDEILIPVAAAMKPDVLGAILAQMQADAAQKLTVKLADRLKLPETQAAPAQLASVEPAPNVAQPSAPAGTPLADAAPAASTPGLISSDIPVKTGATAPAAPATPAAKPAAPVSKPAAK